MLSLMGFPGGFPVEGVRRTGDSGARTLQGVRWMGLTVGAP
jgi:hypothetical protein